MSTINKKETWKLIIQLIVSIATAIATTLGVTSCIVQIEVLITILITLWINRKSYPHIHSYGCGKARNVVIHRVIMKFLEIFPPIFDGKRYKLINFAPKQGIVDKLWIDFYLNKIASTHCVDNDIPNVYIGMGKEMT